MHISFDCPRCLKIARSQAPNTGGEVVCPACSWMRPINEADLNGESPARCLICGCDDLWRQKDFDQRLGVLIVIIGIVLSTIAVAYMRPGIALLILLLFGMADWILYAILPDRLVCYRCHAQYHGVPEPAKTAAFDLEVNERYRQAAIRLKQAEQSGKRV